MYQSLQTILREREKQLLAEVEAVKEQKKKTLAAQKEALEVALLAAKASAEYGSRVQTERFVLSNCLYLFSFILWTPSYRSDLLNARRH